MFRLWFIIILLQLSLTTNVCAYSRFETNVKNMYQKDDLGNCPLFVGDYINWGYYEGIDLTKPLENKDRKKASKNLYEICAKHLDLKSNDKFLEVGCGKGKGLLFLTNKFNLKNVTGVDQSKFYLEESKKRNPKGRFITENAEKMQLKKSFNKILCLEAAQHFSNINMFLEKAYNHLDNDGILVLATFFGLKPNANHFLKNKIQTIDQGVDNAHYIKNIINKLEKLGFVVEIFSIGEKVFPGFDKWTSQTSMHDSWTRNWIKAYNEKLIDYFIIKAYKLNKKNPMQSLVNFHNNENLEKYAFIRQMHKINRNLSFISKRLKSTDIKKIEITDDDLIFTTRKHNLKMHFNGIDRRAAPFEIINFGSYEEEDDKILSELMCNSKVIFDIGANIGWYSLLFSKKYPDAKIFSFEPIPYTFEFLKKNINANNVKNAYIFNKGLSNENKKNIDFFFFPEGTILASQRNILNYDKASKVKCEVQKLDDFIRENKIDKLDFVKCDVEGGELFVLQGGKKSINKFLPIIFIELYHRWSYKFNYHPNDIIFMLKEMGYSCFYPCNNKLYRIKNLDKEPVEERLNYVFLHNEKHKNLIKKLSESKAHSCVFYNQK